MDSILLLGTQDEKLPMFLDRLGYEVLQEGRGDVTVGIVDKRIVDLIVIDSRDTMQSRELCQYLRAHEHTKKVPIVCLTDDESSFTGKGAGLSDKIVTEKIEFIPTSSSIGVIASKIALQMRLRKFDGADSLTATVSEMNATLRDLNERLMKERQEARKIQQALLPKALPRSSAFEIAAHYSPLDEVGGDFYHVGTTPSDRLALLVADVTGHGLAAALIGSMTKLAMSAADREPPDELLCEMNRLMTPQMPDGRFVTLCCALYDPSNGALQFASAGHPPGIVYHAQTKEAHEIKGQGFALGFFEEGEYSLHSQTMEVGDLFICFTDGITEAQNLKGAMYGSEHLLGFLPSLDATLSANEVLAAVLAHFSSFLEGRILKDDVTLLVLKRLR